MAIRNINGVELFCEDTGGDGEVMTSELVWFQACAPPDCECVNGQSAPFCDSRQFGTATFAR